MAEHWSREQLKRIVIAALAEYSRGGGMAVVSGIAADHILDLLHPSAEVIARRQTELEELLGVISS